MFVGTAAGSNVAATKRDVRLSDGALDVDPETTRYSDFLAIDRGMYEQLSSRIHSKVTFR